jgi:hypothetical protein
METVDRIMRGDVIRSIIITENARPAAASATENRSKTEKKTPAANTKKKKRAEN